MTKIYILWTSCKCSVDECEYLLLCSDFLGYGEVDCQTLEYCRTWIW